MFFNWKTSQTFACTELHSFINISVHPEKSAIPDTEGSQGNHGDQQQKESSEVEGENNFPTYFLIHNPP